MRDAGEHLHIHGSGITRGSRTTNDAISRYVTRVLEELECGANPLSCELARRVVASAGVSDDREEIIVVNLGRSRDQSQIMLAGGIERRTVGSEMYVPFNPQPPVAGFRRGRWYRGRSDGGQAGQKEEGSGGLCDAMKSERSLCQLTRVFDRSARPALRSRPSAPRR